MYGIKFLYQLIYENTFIRFSVIGTIGFMSDTAVLYALRTVLPLMIAKIFSYIVAFTVTWALNRCVTFRSYDPRQLRQWFKYATLYTITGCSNVGIFAVFVQQFTYFYRYPIYAMMMTSLAMMLINFTISRSMIFKWVSYQEQGI